MPPFDSRRAYRTLVQQLESLQRAGVTHVALKRAAFPAQHVAAASAPDVIQPAVTPPAPSGRTLFADSQPIQEHAVASAAHPATSPEDRPQALKQLAECVAGCTRCSHLAQTRTQTVFGVGDPQAKIMFVGEAPGADEDRQGEPFVGRAGQLLNKIIAACRLTREEIYICNILKCRPPENRNPEKTEADNCREYLDAQIAIVDPEYIVCWGACAAQNLLDTTQSIGRMRKKFLQHGRAKVLCTYHPSYLLRTPSAKKEVWEDMKLLLRDMGVDPDAN